jgi:hypothetical protein
MRGLANRDFATGLLGPASSLRFVRDDEEGSILNYLGPRFTLTALVLR